MQPQVVRQAFRPIAAVCSSAYGLVLRHPVLANSPESRDPAPRAGHRELYAPRSTAARLETSCRAIDIASTIPGTT